MIDLVLSNQDKVSDKELLPQSEVGLEFEKEASSVFLKEMSCKGRPYGTRSQIVLAGRASGEVQLFERSREPSGGWKEYQHDFSIAGFELPGQRTQSREL